VGAMRTYSMAIFFLCGENARNKAIRFQLKSWDPEQAIAIVQI